MSLANPGLIRLDARKDPDVAQRFRATPTEDVFAMILEAGEYFISGDLAFGPQGSSSSFQGYLELVSATTGLPIHICAGHAQRLRSALVNIAETTHSLSHGLSPRSLDSHFQRHDHDLGKSVAVVLPSNAPGVNGLWFPLIAFRTPIALKPGHADPWTPLRLISAFIQAGLPAEIFSFYPSDHAGSRAVLNSRDAGIIFGNDQTTASYESNPNIQRNGAGYSKVIFGADTSENTQDYLPFLEECVVYNGGRSCTNTSTVVVTTEAESLAKSLAERLLHIQPMPLDSNEAILGGYSDPAVPNAISDALDAALKIPGATDISRAIRGRSLLDEAYGLNFLLPTVILCSDPNHPLAQTEYPFPLVSIVERAEEEIGPWLGHSLAVTAVTSNESLLDTLKNSPKVASLRHGPIPTTSGSWQSPHIGNLFELLHVRSNQHEGTL